MVLVVKAYAGVDEAFIAWRAPFIKDLIGFALRRRIKRAAAVPASPAAIAGPDANGFVEEYVSSWVGFADGPDFPPGTRKPTSEWPIQKYLWSDIAVGPGDLVDYRVVPVIRAADGGLREDLSRASAWSGAVKLGPERNGIEVYFNRGIVASQWLARRLPEGQTEQGRKLSTIIRTPGDPVRDFLGGPQMERVTQLLAETNANGGHIFAALYELEDEQLQPLLKALGKRAHVVLGNGSVKKIGADQNAEARKDLLTVCDVRHRLSSPRALAHNKFLVICDANRKPLSVWTGSMNWTKTGLCTQANNSVHIRNPNVAEQYLKQWQRLAEAGNDTPGTLRASNAKPRTFASMSGTTLWFTPMADQSDLKQAQELIHGAKQGILFLMFNPGPMGTLLNSIIERAAPGGSAYDPDLYVQGVLNQDPSTASTKVSLFHRGARQDLNSDVLLPAAIDKRLKFWLPELLKLPTARAMVHSKVIVLDPFGAKPVVMTGSHNLGPKASGTNDENFLIIEGNAGLAHAYASNIMGIYTQYRWRSKQSQISPAHAWKGLQKNDTWQIDDRHALADWDKRRSRELDFWLGVG